MALYATWNTNVPSPSPVTGWYDTAAHTYMNLPSNRILVDDTIWPIRCNYEWAVENNSKIVLYNRPPPLIDNRETAKLVLHASHDMALVHIEAGNPVPQEIVEYRKALRAMAHAHEPVYANLPKAPT